MQTGRTDLTVFAKDYPEARLVLEVKSAVSSPPEQDRAVKQVVQYMWGANCHYGLIMTPTKTYVLRDDFSSPGPESGQQLERLAREWLERLTASYETALPDDPDVMRAFFPDIVGAVAEGRVVAEVAA